MHVGFATDLISLGGALSTVNMKKIAKCETLVDGPRLSKILPEAANTLSHFDRRKTVELSILVPILFKVRVWTKAIVFCQFCDIKLGKSNLRI